MKNIFRKKKNGKIYNTDFGLDKILIYDSDKASEFNRDKHYFESWGYKVKKIILCDNGSIKLLAVLKKKVLYRCLLDSQKVDPQDRVRPYGGTHPDYCVYYKDGVCTCADPKHCLYQETSHHVSIIKDMVQRYEDHTKNDIDFYNKDRTYYEDTKLGRIFSEQYDHLNAKDNEDKKQFVYRRGVYRNDRRC